MLSIDQQQAVDLFHDFLKDDDQHEMAISGKGGTGKTYLTRYLIDTVNKETQLQNILTGDNDTARIYCTATTNQAAKVLENNIQMDTGTIHSLLGLKVANNFDTGKQYLAKTKDFQVIEKSIIFIDEASMINDELLNLIRENTLKCKVIYIGDSHQLAPVFSQTCPVFDQVTNQVHLTTFHRQARHNPIIELAEGFRTAIDSGVFPKIIPNQPHIELVEGTEFKRQIDLAFKRDASPNHARVLAWTNARVRQYNHYIRGLLTPHTDYQPGEYLRTNNPIIRFKEKIIPTDSIIQIIKIKEGELHDIKGWFIFFDKGSSVFLPKNYTEVTYYLKKLARIKNWNTYFKVKDLFADLRPIYSNTITKSQGATYHTSFIDLADVGNNRKFYERARLMYVGITRASNRVVIQIDPGYDRW